MLDNHGYLPLLLLRTPPRKTCSDTRRASRIPCPHSSVVGIRSQAAAGVPLRGRSLSLDETQRAGRESRTLVGVLDLDILQMLCCGLE